MKKTISDFNDDEILDEIEKRDLHLELNHDIIYKLYQSFMFSPEAFQKDFKKFIYESINIII